MFGPMTFDELQRENDKLRAQLDEQHNDMRRVARDACQAMIEWEELQEERDRYRRALRRVLEAPSCAVEIAHSALSVTAREHAYPVDTQ